MSQVPDPNFALRLSPESPMCSKCINTIDSFLLKSEEDLFHFLYVHGVLLESKDCPKCKNPCHLSPDLSWRCQRSRRIIKNKKFIKINCSFKESRRVNTFFAGSNLSIREICKFVLFAVTINPPKTKFLEHQFGMSSSTVVDWNSFMREVFFDWAVNNSCDKLGGEGIIVEIDEAKMGKRKYNRGRVIEGQWVFGGFERETRQIFVVAVENRCKETLLAVIKEKFLPGTTIISDCWKAYNCLKDEEYEHLTVNHSYNFVDPDTGAHTQHIERTWREVRANVPRYGRKEDHFAGYLAEFFFRRKFPNSTERVHEIFAAIGQLYNPKKPNEKID